MIVTRPTEGSILWVAFAYIHSVRQLHPPLNMEHSMKLASIFPVIVMCAFLAAFQTSDAQATPTHLSASKLVVSKIAMSTWPATHQATWDFWSILRQYLHKNSYGTYGTKSVPVPGTILPFGIGFAGLMAWGSIRAYVRKQRKR